MRRWAAALLACSPALAFAAEDARWYLQVDNDVVFGTDRWYTSGVRIARVAPLWGREVELGLVQEIFTPEAKKFTRGTVDRAPAARLYLGGAVHDRSEARFVTLQLAAGVTGPSAAGERATDAIHEIISAPEVDWRREAHDRFDAHLTYARSDRFGPVSVHHGIEAGNVISFAHAGAEWRFGPASAPPSPILRFAPTPPWDGPGQRGWGGFVGASYRYVARNELLERPYDPLVLAPEREKSVGRIAAGIGWTGGWGSATFAIAQDSREFSGQREPHRFGSLTVHVPF